MRQLIATIALLAFTTILGSSVLDAQMMGGGQGMGGGHAQMSKKAPQRTAQPADTSLAGLMHNSTQMSEMMLQDVSKLQSRLDKALSTTDEQQRETQLKDLKTEMAALHKEMVAEMQMQKRMSTMMQAGGAMEEMMMQPGMIGVSSDGNTPQAKKAYN